MSSRFVTLSFLMLTIATLNGTSASGSANGNPADCGPVPPGGSGFDQASRIEPAPPPLSQFKGLELYSWVEKGVWHYSLVSGKNGSHSKSEIVNSSVTSVDELKKRLSGAANGAEIFWNTRSIDGLSLKKPPKSAEKEIQKICDGWNLKLKRS